jgi:hypothetical protein
LYSSNLGRQTYDRHLRNGDPIIRHSSISGLAIVCINKRPV